MSPTFGDMNPMIGRPYGLFALKLSSATIRPDKCIWLAGNDEQTDDCGM
jgi:hypothetical protein